MTSEDLLDHYKLENEVFPTYTVHYSYRLNRASGGRERLETRWDRQEMIGKGVFGEVWRESSDQIGSSPQVRAVKMLDKLQMKQHEVDVRKELLALAVLSKPKYQNMEVLVSFLNWYENDRFIFLAMEYFGLGDLSKHINDISNEHEIRQITRDLLEALSIIHAEGFVHRDLKPQNIFVRERPPYSSRWWVKVGDFGISKRVKSSETAWRTYTGTQQFTAPEVMGFVDSGDSLSEYINAVDLWSLGCVIYYCSTKRVPFAAPRELNHFCCGRLQFPTELLSYNLSNAGITFVQGFLMPDPNRRLTVADGLKDPWILDVSSPTEDHPSFDVSKGKVAESAAETQVGPVLAGGSLDHDRSLLDSVAQEGQVSQHEMTPNLGTWNSPKDGSDDLNLMNQKATGTTKEAEFQSTTVYPVYDAINQGSTIAVQANHTVQPGTSLRTSDKQEIRPKQSDLHIDHAESADVEDSPPAYREKASPPDSKNSPDASAALLSPVNPVTAPQSGINQWEIIDWNSSIRFRGHTSAITSVAFSPDGRLLVSGSDDKTIRLWHTVSAESHHCIKGHTSSVISVAFSPDGQLLASGSNDKTIRLWDTTTRESRCNLQGHTERIRSVVFSPNKLLLASGSDDKTIRLWHTLTRESHSVLRGHTSWVTSIAFSPDGQLLVSGSNDRTVRLWRVGSGESHFVLQGHTHNVSSVAFSSGGTLFASGSDDHTIRLWHVTTGECHNVLRGHTALVESVAFSRNGILLASGSEDTTIRLWHVETGECRYVLQGHKFWVRSVVFSPDGQMLASGSGDSTVRLWGRIPDQLGRKEKLSQRAGDFAKKVSGLSLLKK